MFFVGMFKLRCVDDGVVWSEEGESDSYEGSKSYRSAQGRPYGTICKLIRDRKSATMLCISQLRPEIGQGGLFTVCLKGFRSNCNNSSAAFKSRLDVTCWT